jgi:hypothetical protein
MSSVRSLLCAVFAILFLVGSNASAQDCNGYDQSEFTLAADTAEQQLGELEKLADTILETGMIGADTGKRVDMVMNAYAGNFFKAYQAAHAAADKAASTEGAEGDARLLTDFELLATRHETRTIALALKWEKIHASVVQGQIKEANLSLPGDVSPLQQLTQEGQQQLAMNDVFRPDFLSIAQRGEAEKNSFGTLCRSAASAVGELIVPTADAALVWKCVGPCKNKNWSACWQCIASAGPAAIQAWNDFQSCWNQNSKWWWRTWCLAKFVARLA